MTSIFNHARNSYSVFILSILFIPARIYGQQEGTRKKMEKAGDAEGCRRALLKEGLIDKKDIVANFLGDG